ncbi:MAG: hypothetical protein HY047_17565 [Acidobacteria bacterium]|nr:hypothetical protein [Acidobacteriota bacterium]
MSRRAALVGMLALSALGAASCGAPLMRLPSGPGTPAPDAADVLAQATRACRAVRTLTAEVAVSGSANGRRVRGRLSAGVAAPASARLEAVAPFGPPIFIFVATGGDATLLLSRDNRVFEHGHPDTVLEAAAGVPLSAEDLHQALTGCAPAAPVRDGRQTGEDWRVITTVEGDELYLRRDSGAWRLVAIVRHAVGEYAWRAEYREPHDGLPRSIHVVSVEAGRIGAAFDLQLALSQVDTNVELTADVFTVRIPPTATRMTLDELRQTGPLAAKSNGR